MRKLSLLLCTLAALSSAAGAQSYTLSLNGKPAGTATISSRQSAGGYQTTATAHVKAQDFSLSLSRTSRLDGHSELISSTINGVVNGQSVVLQLAMQPKSAGAPGSCSLTTTAAGKKSTAALPWHPHTVLLPDFDPGALQTLLDVANENNYRGLWVLLPKQQGQVFAAKLATLADEKGTLDGKVIKVHHLQLSYNDQFFDLFLSEQIELLQAESVAQAYAIVRKGFVLTPVSKPGSAPAHDNQ